MQHGHTLETLNQLCVRNDSLLHQSNKSEQQTINNKSIQNISNVTNAYCPVT